MAAIYYILFFHSKSIAAISARYIFKVISLPDTGNPVIASQNPRRLVQWDTYYKTFSQSIVDMIQGCK